jgi:hypothetical protein
MLLRTLWIKRIIERAFASNKFLEASLDWNEYVREGYKTVVIPQAGLPAGYEVNRVVLPAVITRRVDGDIQYDMNDYTSDPKLITNLEQKQLSYDKMDSELRLMTKNINQGVALDILYGWRPELADSILESTGSAKPSALPGTTGNRLTFAYNDIVDAGLLLDNQDVDSEGRKMLVSATAYAHFLKDPDIKGAFNVKVADASTGKLGEINGFEIYKRSRALVTSDAKVVRLPRAVPAATDSDTIFFWHPDYVGRSVGNVDVLADAAPRPEYFGRVISSQIQAGGSKVFQTQEGVGAIRAKNA